MIRYALLALLREQRDYGYRLKRRFDERIGSVWHLNIGQVYQTLRTLQRAGLVTEVGAAAAGDHLGRRLFELSSKGHRALERWLRRPPNRPKPIRDETLIQLLVLDARREEALARLEGQEQVYRRHLARLLQEKRRVDEGAGGPAMLLRVGLEAALLHTEAHLKWLEHCHHLLKEAAENDPQQAERTAGR